jgi:hypothetical protein
MTDPDSPLEKLVSAWVARRPSCLRGAPAGSQGARARNPSDRDGTRGGWGMETRSAGPGGFRALIPRHPARVGEIMQVRWFDYYGAILFGDKYEIACIPHGGCYLEILGTGETSHREVNLLLPGRVIRYTRPFLFGDRFELPSGARVGLCISWASNCSWHHARPLPHQSRRSLPGAEPTRIGPCLPARIFRHSFSVKARAAAVPRQPATVPLERESVRRSPRSPEPSRPQPTLLLRPHSVRAAPTQAVRRTGADPQRASGSSAAQRGMAIPEGRRRQGSGARDRSAQLDPPRFAGTRGRSVDPTTILTPLRGYRSRVPTRSLPTSGSTTSRSSARTPG